MCSQEHDMMRNGAQWITTYREALVGDGSRRGTGYNLSCTRVGTRGEGRLES